MNLIKYHIGCGKRDFGPDWIHIDGEKHPHVKDDDVFLWNAETGAADIIYSSHLLEYMDLMDAYILLGQWHRALKPGGILRVAVPDFEAMARLYASDPEKYPLKSFIGPLYGKMIMGNSIIYHKYCYDFTTLKNLLLVIDFTKVERYNWCKTEHAHIDDHSKAYLPHDPEAIRTGTFTDKHTLISLNVEATK